MTAFRICRSDHGDGGWSLHAVGATDHDIATGAAPALASGPSDWDEEIGNWLRPNTKDFEAAKEIGR